MNPEPSLELFGHPFSSYTWKALIPLYAYEVPFAFRILDQEHPDHAEVVQMAGPLGKFPVLRDPVRDATIGEASIIVEYLALHEPGTFHPLPTAPDAALEVRLMDRLFDNYVMTPMQACVGDRLRPEAARDAHGLAQTRAALAKSYAMLDQRLAGRNWAAGADFSLADCAAAPALYYADRVIPFRTDYPVLAAYLDRLEARPSFARVLREMQPWWHNFPFADGPLAS